MKNKKLIIPILLLAFVAFAVAEYFIVSGMFGNEPSTGPIPMEPENTEPVEKNDGTISIPGYEYLTLAADQTEQSMRLYNPPENNCLFVVSLILEDGTVLWQSEPTEPGYQTDIVTLSKPLEAGMYNNCILKYECFTNDGMMKQLNGADTKVALIVK